jgi:hypothetical protein
VTSGTGPAWASGTCAPRRPHEPFPSDGRDVPRSSCRGRRQSPPIETSSS